MWVSVWLLVGLRALYLVFCVLLFYVWHIVSVCFGLRFSGLFDFDFSIDVMEVVCLFFISSYILGVGDCWFWFDFAELMYWLGLSSFSIVLTGNFCLAVCFWLVACIELLLLFGFVGCLLIAVLIRCFIVYLCLSLLVVLSCFLLLVYCFRFVMLALQVCVGCLLWCLFVLCF